MRLITGCFWVALLVLQAGALQSQDQPQNSIWERESTASPPECSSSCLATFVPQYCGSVTNTTCLCTSKPLSAAIQPCALAACNITDGLQLQLFVAQTCNVPNDKSRLHQIWVLVCTMTPITFLFLAARIFIRIKLEVGIGLDDWMILASFAAFMATIAGAIKVSLGNYGVHTFWLSTSQLVESLKWFYVQESIYLIQTTFTKLSLLFFFRRIFPDKKFHKIIWIVSALIVVINSVIMLTCIFKCIPIHGAWTNWMYKEPPIHCLPAFPLAYASAGNSIIWDLVIIALPLPTLWRLNLTLPKKLNLLVMFCLGIFVTICSACRLPTLVTLNGSNDPSWDQTPIIIWTVLEQGVGVICACLPACRSLIGYLFPALKLTLRSSGRGRTGSNTRNTSTNKRSKANPTLGNDFFELERTSESHIDIDDTAEAEEARSFKSENSQTPIQDKLVPHNKENGFSREVKVDVTDVNEDSSSSDVAGSGITLTKTVKVSRKTR